MNNNYLYSPSENNFPLVVTADSYRKAGTLPDDCIPVSDDIFNEYTGTPPVGKVRGAVDGKPGWVNIPALASDQLQLIAENERSLLRAAADSEISWRQDAVSEGIATEKEAAELAEWKKYRVQLMRVDLNDPSWPSKP